MNSPDKIIHRLIHDDYFKNVPQSEMELWIPKISIHVITCQNNKCKELRKDYGIIGTQG